MPIGLWDVEALTFSRQSAHSWQWGCQPYAPATVYPPGIFLVLISVGGGVDPRTKVWLEELGQLKNPMISSGIEPATFRFSSTVPQPTMLPRSPRKKHEVHRFLICNLTPRRLNPGGDGGTYWNLRHEKCTEYTGQKPSREETALET
jgi:hypothetical protein